MKRAAVVVFVGIIVAAFLMVFGSPAMAKVTGVCSNCHTMHYSQTPWPEWWNSSGGPYRALTVNDCLGCHSADSGVTKTLGTSTVPVVFTTTEPTYTVTGLVAGVGEVLAGGNFYWADTSDAKGHNVSGIGSTTFTEPPGYSQAENYGRPATWDMSKFTCAGTYGCHGKPDVEDPFAAISGAHHTDDSCLKLATYDDTEAGSIVGKSYRFLLGIKGIEDNDWEKTASSSEHNVYLGEDRTSDAISSTHTISYLCAECHGDFHSGTGNKGMDDDNFGSPWLRHPTDYDMGNVQSKEYGNYGAPGTTDHSYSVIAPVGWAALSANMPIDKVTFSDDTIVLCVSCHRAHGTPNDDILRWDYSLMDAGSSDDPRNEKGGCFICHTTK